jgi:hypothetical protein
MTDLQKHLEHVITQERGGDLAGQAGYWPPDVPYYLDRVRETWVRVTKRDPDTKEESTAWYRDIDGHAFVVRTASQIFPECSREDLAGVLEMALSPQPAQEMSRAA